MTTRLGKMVNYLELLLPMKSHGSKSSGIAVSRKKSETIHYISFTTMPMVTTLDRMVTYCERFSPIFRDLVILQNQMRNQNHCISSTTMLFTTKLGSIVTCYKELPVITSKNSLKM